jgi:putative membrane protein
MNTRRRTDILTTLALAGVVAVVAAPAGAASLPVAGVGALPEAAGAQPAHLLTAAAWTAGAGALVPAVATDAQANSIVAIEAPAEGGEIAGKPIDDAQFVRRAAESSRQEIDSAHDALTQLKDPGLKEIAGMLIADHAEANAKLARIAAARGWPLPETRSPDAPPSGTSAADFDAKWTAEAIADHERTVALYRAQAQGGEDRDLRRFANDTLPTIERHLAQLRSLQK